MPNKEPTKTEVLRGTLDLMVLQTLDSQGPMHGYMIAARLEQVSSGALSLNMGTLYPATTCPISMLFSLIILCPCLIDISVKFYSVNIITRIVREGGPEIG